MNYLVRSLFVILSVVSFGANSYSGVTASDSPAMFLFRVCREAGTDVRDATEPLLRAGWTDVTSAASLRRVVTERNHIRVRAKLSRSSYPEPWDDATVRRSYPSTMARTMDELVAHVNRNTEAELKSPSSRREFVFSAPSGNAVAAIFYWPSYLFVRLLENQLKNQAYETSFIPNFLHRDKKVRAAAAFSRLMIIR